MPINYVPSWWEQYAPQINQAGQGIIEGVLNKFAPDYQAQHTFKQLAMQNPSLVSEVANMDDGERQVFAKTLGAKNKDPFKNIGVGSKRKERERIEQERASLTPDEAKGSIVSQFGTKTQEEIDADRLNRSRQGILFDQGQEERPLRIESLKIDNKANQIKLKDLERKAAEQDAVLEAVPEMRGIRIDHAVEDALQGTLDPMIRSRIEGNEGLAKNFADRMETRRNQIAASVIDRQINLRDRKSGSTRTPLDVLINQARILKDGANSATQTMSALITERDKILSKDKNLKNYMSLSPEYKAQMLKVADPANVSALQAVEQQIQSAKEDKDFMTEALGAALRELPVVQRADSAKAAGGGQSTTGVQQTVTPNMQKAEALLSAGKVTINDVLTSTMLSQQEKDYLQKKYGAKK